MQGFYFFNKCLYYTIELCVFFQAFYFHWFRKRLFPQLFSPCIFINCIFRCPVRVIFKAGIQCRKYNRMCMHHVFGFRIFFIPTVVFGMQAVVPKLLAKLMSIVYGCADVMYITVYFQSKRIVFSNGMK